MLWPRNRHPDQPNEAERARAAAWRESGLQPCAHDSHLAKLSSQCVAWRSLAPIVDPDAIKTVVGQLASTPLLAPVARTETTDKGELAIKACTAISGAHAFGGRFGAYPGAVLLRDHFQAKGPSSMRDTALRCWESHSMPHLELDPSTVRQMRLRCCLGRPAPHTSAAPTPHPTLPPEQSARRRSRSTRRRRTLSVCSRSSPATTPPTAAEAAARAVRAVRARVVAWAAAAAAAATARSVAAAARAEAPRAPPRARRRASGSATCATGRARWVARSSSRRSTSSPCTPRAPCSLACACVARVRAGVRGQRSACSPGVASPVASIRPCHACCHASLRPTLLLLLLLHLAQSHRSATAGTSTCWCRRRSSRSRRAPRPLPRCRRAGSTSPSRRRSTSTLSQPTRAPPPPPLPPPRRPPRRATARGTSGTISPPDRRHCPRGLLRRGAQRSLAPRTPAQTDLPASPPPPSAVAFAGSYCSPLTRTPLLTACTLLQILGGNECRQPCNALALESAFQSVFLSEADGAWYTPPHAATRRYCRRRYRHRRRDHASSSPVRPMPHLPHACALPLGRYTSLKDGDAPSGHEGFHTALRGFEDFLKYAACSEGTTLRSAGHPP